MPLTHIHLHFVNLVHHMHLILHVERLPLIRWAVNMRGKLLPTRRISVALDDTSLEIHDRLLLFMLEMWLLLHLASLHRLVLPLPIYCRWQFVNDGLRRNIAEVWLVAPHTKSLSELWGRSRVPLCFKICSGLRSSLLLPLSVDVLSILPINLLE